MVLWCQRVDTDSPGDADFVNGLRLQGLWDEGVQNFV